MMIQWDSKSCVGVNGYVLIKEAIYYTGCTKSIKQTKLTANTKLYNLFSVRNIFVGLKCV